MDSAKSAFNSGKKLLSPRRQVVLTTRSIPLPAASNTTRRLPYYRPSTSFSIRSRST